MDDLRLTEWQETRRDRNKTEAAFRKAAAAAGWTPTKRGWPDFILYRGDDEVAFVEVKRSPRQPLRRAQLRVMQVLADAGFPVFRWDPVKGFVRVRATRRRP